MEKSRNAAFEFVRDVTHGDGGAPLPESGQAARDAEQASFEFVKKLASELSAGSFELPPFPEVAMRVRDALSDPDVSVDKIARIVVSEPVLSVRLFRMANSATMRRGSSEITDLKVAISRLGFDMVRNAAVSLAMDSSFSVPAKGALKGHIERTRRHSVEVAALSYVLAKRCAAGIRPDEAMLAGLLHAIGRFYILTRVDAFPALFNHERVLEDMLSDWYTGVGRAIVESWGFPESIAVAVDEHMVLDRSHLGAADMTDVVLVANRLASRAEVKDPPIESIPAFAKLKLDEQWCEMVIAESEEEVRSMSQALSS